jgi:hypothetical protein
VKGERLPGEPVEGEDHRGGGEPGDETPAAFLPAGPFVDRPPALERALAKVASWLPWT